jgi:hypothetical protein
MDTTTKLVFCILATSVICVLAGWLGANVPYGEQAALYGYTQSLAALLLGVAGAWSFLVGSTSLRAVFAPTREERKNSPISDRQVRVVRQIAWTVAGSTVIIFASQLVFLVAPLLKQQPALADHVELLRGLSFGFITLLSLVEFYLLYLAITIIFQFHLILKNHKSQQDRDQAIPEHRTISESRMSESIPGVRE